MIDALITVTAILGIGLLAVELLPRRSAALRHAVLTIALGCAAVAPAFRPVVPAWHVSPRLLQPGRPPLAIYIPIEATDLPDGGATTPVTEPVDVVARRWLVRAWIAGIVLGGLFLATGFGRLAWIAARSRRVTEGRRFALLEAMSRDFALPRPVVLLQSDHPSLLVTFGLRPRIILPRASEAWTRERERVVLGHELAHIARRDWLVHVAAELVRVVYWFNPLVWIACRRLRRESEQACDDAVLGMGVAGADYASHLLELARAYRSAREPFIPAPAMARPSSLERRVTAMLNNQLNRAPLTSSACVTIAVALLTVTLSVAGVRASADANAQFSGTLVDAVGRIMPDAPMTLTSGDGLQRREARSDQAGHFSFTGLAGGDYVLGVNVPGFATTQGRVTLGDGQNLAQDVALQLGLLHETISVTNGPAADARRSAPLHYEPKPSTCPQTITGGCIEAPTRLVDVRPLFPPELSGLGHDVVVQLEARIGTDGFVNDVRALAPANEAAALAAANAVRQWRFSQTRLDGVPVEVRMDVRINFRGE